MQRNPKNPSDTPTRPSVPRVQVRSGIRPTDGRAGTSNVDTTVNTAVTLAPPAGDDLATGLEDLPPTTPFRATLPPDPPSLPRTPIAAMEPSGVMRVGPRAETRASVPQAMRAAAKVDLPGGFGDLEIGFPFVAAPAAPPPSIEFEDEPGSASFAAVLPEEPPTARGRALAFAPLSQSPRDLRDDGDLPPIFATKAEPSTRARADAQPAPVTERHGRGSPRMRRSEPPDVASPADASRAFDALTAGSHRTPRAASAEPPPTVRSGKKPSSPPLKRDARDAATRGVARRDSGRDGRSAFAAVDEVVANLKKDPRSE